MNQSWDARCLCGAVRFNARGAPKWTIWCHCQSCRKHSGAPVSAFACFDAAVVQVTRGAIAKFASSPGVLRGFCSTCGSTLSCESDRSPGEVHFHIGAFDQPERLAPIAEVYPEERLAWVHLGADRRENQEIK